MPQQIRWFIKSSMLCFVLAIAVWFLLAARSVLELPYFIASLKPVFYHLLMVGWVTQMIFGVSIWMFPSYSSDRRFGSETLVWVTWWTLNLGLLLRVLIEPMVSLLGSGAIWGWLLVTSALLQWFAGLVYVYNIWGRVKGK